MQIARPSSASAGRVARLDLRAIEFGDERRVFESEFDTTELATDDPGFGSEVERGFGITPGHVIDDNILGALEYHNGTSFAPVPAGAKIDASACNARCIVMAEQARTGAQ